MQIGSGMRMLGWISLVILLAASGASATPAQLSSGEVEMQALLNNDGSGHLFVNNTDGPWAWESCTPELTQCSQLAGDRELSTRGVEPPVVFRVKSEGMTGVSPEWRGPVTQLSEPTVSGVVQANEFVSPVPGGWARGWKGEYSELQLSACETADGGNCTTLTNSHYVRQGCSKNASFIIAEKFAGQYLRVANRRIGAGPHARPLYGVTSPYGPGAWRRNRITSVAVVGRIAAPTKGDPGECGPPVPNEAWISKRGVAFVRCSESCRATLTASRAGNVARSGRELPFSRFYLIVAPPEQVALTPDQFARLGNGSIRLALRVEGKLLAQRIVRSTS